MALSTQDIREILMTAGPDLPVAAAQRIVDAGGAAVPALLDVLQDAELDDTEGDVALAPLHAARLLGTLQAPAAVPPMVELLAGLAPDDVLSTAIVLALQGIGAAARDAVLAALRATKDPEARASYADVLAGLGVRDAEVRGELLAYFQDDPGFGATCLAGYGDPAVLPDLYAAFDANQVLDDWDFDDPHFSTAVLLDVADAIATLGGSLEGTRAAKLTEARRVRDEIWKIIGWESDAQGFPVEPGGVPGSEGGPTLH